MFNSTHQKILENLTHNSREEMVRLSLSILKKIKDEYPWYSEDEEALIHKIDSFIFRSHFKFEHSFGEILLDCSKSLTCKLCERASQPFVKDATRQSASEKAQMEHMMERGFPLSKMTSSGQFCVRFNESSQNFTSIKIEGKTSRSFDYKRTYDGITEYFLGKVVFSQGGHQNTVKSEIVDFLTRANLYLNNNVNSSYIFTALIDGDSLTKNDIKEYQKYCNHNVRLCNSDTYQPYFKLPKIING
jgi:hypothetical protein